MGRSTHWTTLSCLISRSMEISLSTASVKPPLPMPPLAPDSVEWMSFLMAYNSDVSLFLALWTIEYVPLPTCVMEGKGRGPIYENPKKPAHLLELLIQPALQVADEANNVDQGIWVHESPGALVPAMLFQLSQNLDTSVSTREDVNDRQQSGSEPNPGEFGFHGHGTQAPQISQ